MESKFLIKSEKHGCDITFTYSSNGLLLGFVVSKELSQDAINDIVGNAFYHKSNLINRFKAPKLAHLMTEILPDLSFESFFEKYKYNPDKKRAKDVYEKLDEKARAGAIAYIPKYEAEIRKTGAAKMYAKTYLRGRIWEV